MSNKTQLSNNNTQLASLIQELQGKAAGGGSGAEKCTVTLYNVDYCYCDKFYESGVYKGQLRYTVCTTNPYTLDIYKNTTILCKTSLDGTDNCEIEGGELIDTHNNLRFIYLTSNTATIRLVEGGNDPA